MNCQAMAAAAVLLVLAGCQRAGDAVGAGAAAAPEKLLYVWAGDLDGSHSDFLATIDADPASPDYGRIIATTPAGAKNTYPHHTEYDYPQSGLLLANGWGGAKSFAFDMSEARAPKLAATFGDVGGYSYLHSFARLPDGRIVGTFQGRNGAYGAPGGLVEMTERGELLRAVSATAPGVDETLAWPYSLVFAPAQNRLIVSMSEMGMAGQTSWADTKSVQIYDADTLTLEAVVDLPPDGAGSEMWPAEPRVAPDGEIYVNTFACGLYRLEGVGTAAARAVHIHSFPRSAADDMCAVPVFVGKFFVQTVTATNGLIALDLSDPQKPVEVSRLRLDHAYHMPHWLAADADGRLVITGNNQPWVLMASIDRETGALSLDGRFRDAGADRPGVFFGAQPFPHGDSGPAQVHGALFRR